MGQGELMRDQAGKQRHKRWDEKLYSGSLNFTFRISSMSQAIVLNCGVNDIDARV